MQSNNLSKSELAALQVWANSLRKSRPVQSSPRVNRSSPSQYRQEDININTSVPKRNPGYSGCSSCRRWKSV